MFKTIKILSAFFLFFLSGICVAQVSPELSFRHLNIDNGLSHDLVSSIYQDHEGYMWIGTQDGLNKYDGYKNRIYRNNPLDSTSIPSNTVNCIYEDNNRDLWIGLLNYGLVKYNRKFDRFERYPSEKTGIHSRQVLCMYEDPEGNFWIGTQNGLFNMNRENDRAEMIPYDEDSLMPDAASSAAVFDVLMDQDGNLWIGTYNGLNLYDPDNKNFRHYFPEGEQADFSRENWIKNIFVGWNEQLWICTHRGFMIFDREKEKFYDGFKLLNIPSPPEEIRLNKILLDEKNNIWFCGWQRNFYYSTENKQLSQLSHDEFDAGSLSGNSVTECFLDNIGGVWLGTWNAGVNYYNHSFKKFGLIRKTPHESSLSGKIVRAVTCDKNNNLWLGIDIGGLNFIDRTSGNINHIRHDPQNENSLIHDNIRHLLWENEESLWIATQQGLDLYNTKAKTFKHFLNDPVDKNSLVNNDIRFLEKDVYGKLWIGTYNGLSIYDPVNEDFTSYINIPGDSNSISNNQIYSIYEDSDKNIWIGTGDGLNHFVRNKNSFIRFYNQPGDSSSLSNNRVISIYEDSKGRLWIGTYGGGLNQFNGNNRKFKRYTFHDGLANNVVYGILEDDIGNLWLSTNQGLSRFDPESEEFTNYKKEDGLQSNQFYFNSFHKNEEGELFFGGVKGLNYFHPSRIYEDKHKPSIIITSFKLFNNEVPVSDPSSKNSILTKNISQTDTIILRHNQSVFSFGFTAIHHAQPLRNQYAYKLEGLEEKWNYVKDVRVASYSNLDQGEYIFRVKASNNDNVWNEEGASLFIEVLPPWWETTLFRIVLSLLIIGVLYLLFLMISNQEKLRANLKLERIQAAQAREMDEMKQKFYSNISHEFRTPLTLILGPAEKLLKDEGFSEENLLHFGIIHKNASRLLKLVNQLLDLTRIEAGFMKLDVAGGDIISFLSSIADSFNYRAEKLNINFTKDLESRAEISYFDGDKIEKILYNLLSNAFRFTPEGGKIQLIAKIEKERISGNRIAGRSVVIEVRDSGKGIPEAMKNRIFDRFVQSDDHNSEYKGTGIGLTLVKQLTEIHKGEISVESEGRKGSTFRVRIPVSYNYYSEEEIKVEQKVPDIFYEKEEFISLPDSRENAKHPLVLIIEDNPDIRLFIRKNLSGKFRFEEASNGKEGFEMSSRIKPDLIVCDIMMDGMDGIELCTRVKSTPGIAHIPFLIITALPGDKDKLSGLKAGAEDYIVKPFNLEELELKLENLYRSSQHAKELYSRTIRLVPENIQIDSAREVFLKRAVVSVERNMDNPDFGIEELCRDTGTSRMQLYRKVRATTDKTVKEFIRELRLERAGQLLQKGHLTVNEVAYMSGFRELSYFRKCFKEKYGKTPSAFAEEVRK